MLDQLRAALPEAEALVDWAAALPMPDDRQTFTNVSLRHADRLPVRRGSHRIRRRTGYRRRRLRRHFAEEHRAQSTALFSSLHGEPYLVGPLARLNLNLDRLPAASLALLATTGIPFPSSNMFHSLLARALEIHVAIVEAIRLLEGYSLPSSHTSRSRQRPGSDSAPPRHRAACCGIAMRPTHRASSRAHASCRRPARIRHASRPICTEA